MRDNGQYAGHLLAASSTNPAQVDMYSINFGPKPSASRCALDTGVAIDSKDAWLAYF